MNEIVKPWFSPHVHHRISLWKESTLSGSNFVNQNLSNLSLVVLSEAWEFSWMLRFYV